jgi:cytochrome c oxidase subunit 2
MEVSGYTALSLLGHATPAQVRSPADVFDSLFLVFVTLGTIVGVIVISYTLYNAYKYRSEDGDREGGYDIEESGPDEDADVARPQLGEIPTGSGKGGGKKLFLSFGISAFIVLGLIIYGYMLLLHVEGEPQNHEDAIEIDVQGYQFGWDYTYPNGETASTLRVPAGEVIKFNITSADVMHNFRIQGLGASGDAIPGQTTESWISPDLDEVGEYKAKCLELCGAGHSNMIGDVYVMEPGEYEEWYNDLGGGS